MKKHRLLLACCSLLALAGPARAVTFTNNTFISFTNNEFDGQDIALSNCTVTVDGFHPFASVHVLGGGILTHSYSSNGVLQNIVSVTAEPHLLSDTNPAALDESNVLTNTVLVQDPGGLITYTPGVDYAILDASPLTLIGRLTNSAIPNGGSIAVSYFYLGQSVPTGLNLAVTNDFEIEPNGQVTASGVGFGPGLGVGAGLSHATNYPYPYIAGGGGGYGGFGGASSSLAAGGTAYGSGATPTNNGSGGGAGSGVGGAGGGSVVLAIGGRLRVDGQMSADGARGTNAHSGGGSGGSIWLTAQTASGLGSISANGGAGEPGDGGGGGGGRIALILRTNGFTGSLTAAGGAGAVYGGAGTIFTEDQATPNGMLTADNGGHSGADTLLSAPGTVDATIGGGAIVIPRLSDASLALGSLIVRSNSWLTLLRTQTMLNVTVARDALIEAGGGVLADALGFAGGAGPGLGGSVSGYGGGGGYGGYGGASFTNAPGGNSYGDPFLNVNRGSGGGAGAGIAPHNSGGAGGGLVLMTVAGKLQLEGKINANGGDGIGQGSGGGSGGEVWLSAGTFSGAGFISASGGSAALPNGGGGGGGRIAIACATNQFSGILAAHGGPGAHAGGAGTVYSKTNGTQFAQLTIDNGGLSGTNTPWPIGTIFELTVSGGAIVNSTVESQLNLRKLVIRSNSWVSYLGKPANLNISGDAVIDAGGGFQLDGQGYGGSFGPGGGRTLVVFPYGNTGGGAGNGGYGGNSGLGASGGLFYGTIPFQGSVADWGSGGGLGNGSSTNNAGGSGGGLLNLSVLGTLTLNGKITANGGAGIGQWSGGGSGGSISLSVGGLAGQGTVSANGGPGDFPYGGGGAGGRIQIIYGTNHFLGSFATAGGAGAVSGGAGTVYIRDVKNSWPLIIVDNGGASGTNTPLSYTAGQFDLRVNGGAVTYLASSTISTMGNLFVGSNSWLSFTSPFSPSVVTVLTNATVQAGGGITLDGAGPRQGNGAGGTLLLTGGGGGYGGYGGRSATNAPGGNPYGSVVSPSDLGSPGGTGGVIGTSSAGGLGGGALHLTVNGTLLLDGRLSAGGNPGVGQNSGGGSGGGLWLSLGQLRGAGVIAANGGAGESPGGGGGGGGRISIISATNLFTGGIAARGGAGANPGGAGTVFLSADGKRQSSLIVDNGGSRGASTGLGTLSDYDLTVTGGAQLILSNVTTIGNLLVGTNSSLSYTSQYSPRTLTITSNATIQPGGAVVLDGQGSPRAQGPGAGVTLANTGGGGGYGGYGGRSAANAAGGNVYGLLASPVDPGSGGGGIGSDSSPVGSAGGGALHLTVGGTLVVDGRLTADGNAASSLAAGGGSGGSLWLAIGRLSGGGLISANGGAGDFPVGGGGGGGRIAIIYGTNLFAGIVSAHGGPGANSGGAGSIYLKSNFSSIAQIVADNGGILGTNTPISLPACDLTVTNGARILVSSATSLSSLSIGSNSWLLFSFPNYQSSLIVTGSATIRAGGGLTLDGQGFPAGQGRGSGGTVFLAPYGATGGGGGNAGFGGRSLTAAGGITFGSESAPSDFGSGGGAGNGTATNNLGGAGGGALHLTVLGTLALDGRISADGTPGIGQWSGGGSGGDLWLTVGTLTGNSGLISANGGAGDLPYGGGGGGGRVSITAATNVFQGAVSARGGVGFNSGGAGSFYRRVNSSQIPGLFFDNGGASGTNTPLSLVENFDLFISGGAKVNPNNSLMIHNLTIRSNSWLNQLPGLNRGLVVSASGFATVDAGGGFTVVSAGQPGGRGLGAGGSLFLPAYGALGGGGGYGGFGAASFQNASGGGSYGSILQPLDLGSGGGGGGFNNSPPPPGGGAIHLTVSQSLTLNGQILADGGDASIQGSGGGSGGSIWLSAGVLTGSGEISADGGAGDYVFGGGGGGGRVAIYSGTNLFAGTTHAWGGSGAEIGGAGTLYSRRSSEPVGQLVVDNGGGSGTNTPLLALEAFNLSVLGGAVVNPAATAAPMTLSSLRVDSGASFTHLVSQSNLDLIVLGNATIGSNASVAVNGKGFTGASAGPGGGQVIAGSGSGAGYGGPGGASLSGTPGGVTYGSALLPADLGSRGGLDLSPTNGNFCSGGGAIRMRVANTLLVNGRITANGDDAVVDRAGGGSGGSVWITARTLAGQGFITANGGAGEPEEGGGGGGGRIAIYTRTNSFPGPIVAFGNFGAVFGGNGTVIITNIPPPQVVTQIPSGVVNYAVNSVDLTFDSLLNPATISSADASLDTPDGILPPPSLTVAALDPSRLRINFPPQTSLGYYELQAGPAIEDIYGLPMSAAYVGSFVILPPVISGRVADGHGAPVEFVTIRPSGGLASTVTDASGNYSLEVTPSWNGTLTPSKGSSVFLPASRTYASVAADLTNQNFVVITPAMLTITQQRQGTNLNLSWYGINGVAYQPLYSTDLTTWLPYQGPLFGTNGPLSLLVPLDQSPSIFFRFGAGY